MARAKIKSTFVTGRQGHRRAETAVALAHRGWDVAIGLEMRT